MLLSSSIFFDVADTTQLRAVINKWLHGSHVTNYAGIPSTYINLDLGRDETAVISVMFYFSSIPVTPFRSTGDFWVVCHLYYTAVPRLYYCLMHELNKIWQRGQRREARNGRIGFEIKSDSSNSTSNKVNKFKFHLSSCRFYYIIKTVHDAGLRIEKNNKTLKIIFKSVQNTLKTRD